LFKLTNNSISVAAQFLNLRQLFRGKTLRYRFRDQFRKLLPWGKHTSAHTRVVHAITLLKAALNLLISSWVPTLTRM
jgi:hypothetical protein